MGLGTDLLNLRRSKLSTVEALLAGIDRVAEATSDLQIRNRVFMLNELGDAVLAKVAVYALENGWSEEPQKKARRAIDASRRRVRRSDSGQLDQRRLFA